MSDRKGWKTVRVVVEVAVQGDYTEKDLRWDVAKKLEGFIFRLPQRDASMCVPRVKEFGRFIRSKRT